MKKQTQKKSLSELYFFPKKASALMISLWILVILTMLAVSIGHRVSLGLRLSGYQRDRLKALYLAKAGVNRAIVELEKDINSYDAINELWADNEDVFKKITLNDNQNEFATISYNIIDVNGGPKTIYGMTDEERKININTAPKELLISLLEKYNVIDAQEITNNICAWRGDTNISVPSYQDLGYSNKSDKFSNKEELMLVKGVTIDSYNLIKELITTYGSGKINLNTTSAEILEIVIDSCVKKLENEDNAERNPEDLVSRIVQLREGGAVFESLSDLKAKLENQKSITSAQNNILNKLQEVADTKSTCFSIMSSGKISKINYNIKSVFDRDKKKIVFWHES